MKHTSALPPDLQSNAAWPGAGYALDQDVLRGIVREELAAFIGLFRAELNAHEDRKAFTGRNPFLTLAQTEELTGLSRKTIWQRRSAGNFVKAHGLRNRPMFLRDDVVGWMESQAER